MSLLRHQSSFTMQVQCYCTYTCIRTNAWYARTVTLSTVLLLLVLLRVLVDILLVTLPKLTGEGDLLLHLDGDDRSSTLHRDGRVARQVHVLRRFRRLLPGPRPRRRRWNRRSGVDNLGDRSRLHSWRRLCRRDANRRCRSRRRSLRRLRLRRRGLSWRTRRRLGLRHARLWRRRTARR